MLRTATRQAVTALGLLAVALAAVVFLVTSAVYPGTVAVPLTAGMFTLAAAAWFALPLSRRRR